MLHMPFAGEGSCVLTAGLFDLIWLLSLGMESPATAARLMTPTRRFCAGRKVASPDDLRLPKALLVQPWGFEMRYTFREISSLAFHDTAFVATLLVVVSVTAIIAFFCDAPGNVVLVLILAGCVGIVIEFLSRTREAKKH